MGTVWVVDYATALRTALVAYAVGALFVGISYWDLLYHLIAQAILLKWLALNSRPNGEPVASTSGFDRGAG